MTHTPDHLPECLVPDFDNARWVCICSQLRACERRAREDERHDRGIPTMTDHLPECCLAPHVCDVNLCQRCHSFCICNQLRACEERVHETAYQAGKAYGLNVNGYTRGLDAARKAVEGLDLHGCMPRGSIRCNCIVTSILAAIDALRDAK